MTTSSTPPEAPDFSGPTSADYRPLSAIEVALPVALAPELAAKIDAFQKAAKAPSTRRAYLAGWRKFTQWCQERGHTPLPALPAIVGAYLSDRAGALKVATLQVHLASINHAHKLAKLPTSPTKSAEVQTILEGIKNTYGTAPQKKAALLVGDVTAITSRLPEGVRADRDRAALLVGFCGGFRRHELVDLDVEHLAFKSEGVSALLRWSKTDQHGRGKTKRIGYGADASTCPVTALRRWLSVAGITSGPVFRAVDRHGRVRAKRLSAKAIAGIVKRLGAELGIDPTKLGGHSLRSGFVTSADAAGISEREIASVTFQSLPVLRDYIQEGETFRADIVRRLGL